ncbi:hypothetical protein DB347_20725 [Opitutaceae bacterium EW11]|nr:hypothetical protein DB347_20725 [Opitutaceae bacterium EW11]
MGDAATLHRRLMPDSSQPANVRDLLKFRDALEMGDGLFAEVTGLEVVTLFAFRRGKLKERPQIASAAVDRIARCREALALAKELGGGDEEKSLDWLYADSPTFGGRSPIDLTVSDAAFEVVRGYVARLRAAVLAAAVPTAPPPQVQTKGPEEPPEEPPVVPADAAEKSRLAPPKGIAPGDRVFRVKEPLARVRERRPELTLKKISVLMTERGFKQFGSSAYMSRVANSYTWLTWEEVVAMAEALEVDPTELGTVFNVPE